MNRFAFLAAALFALCALTGCPKKEEKKDGAVIDPEVARVAARDRMLASHHDKCVELFVKAEGFGGGRMPVLTHTSPNYPKSLDLPGESELDEAGNPLPARPAAWVMDKVELVSLLMNTTPGVYSAGGMQRVVFQRPRTRELDGFETVALSALQAGENVRVEEANGQVRVLGAIRMRNDCKSCHKEKAEGALLGAFTYTFKPAR